MSAEHQRLECLVVSAAARQAESMQRFFSDGYGSEGAQALNTFVNDTNARLDQRFGDKCPARLVFQAGGRVALSCGSESPDCSLRQ